MAESRTVRPWPPLAGLTAEQAHQIEQALGSAHAERVSEVIVSVSQNATSPHARASIWAAQFALSLRSGESGPGIEQQGQQLREQLREVDDLRGAFFVDVERAYLISARRERISEAVELLDQINAGDDHELLAATLRARGSLARARADLRGSLFALEQSRVSAESSGSLREILRTNNTLGTSYTALGVGELARVWLERARELALVSGQLQSAAISSGQLAVIAMDANQPMQAARYLEIQRNTARQLGDFAGESRALSLLVEAYSACMEPSKASDAANQCRDLYSRHPSPWTHLQAVLASMYEAEQALLARDMARANLLLESCSVERSSSHPAHRVVRAREAFITLARASVEPGDPTSAIEDALVHLRRSPRPAWVERALVKASSLAESHALHSLASTLATRAALVREARGAAGSGALGLLEHHATEFVITRAMALGRDLVARARLALAPFVPFDAYVVRLTTTGETGSVDHVISGFYRPESPGEPPDDLLTILSPPDRATLVSTNHSVIMQGLGAAQATGQLVECVVSQQQVRVSSDASIGLGLLFSTPVSAPSDKAN